jgi:hypothetical protein
LLNVKCTFSVGISSNTSIPNTPIPKTISVGSVKAVPKLADVKAKQAPKA